MTFSLRSTLNRTAAGKAFLLLSILLGHPRANFCPSVRLLLLPLAKKNPHKDRRRSPPRLDEGRMPPSFLRKTCYTILLRPVAQLKPNLTTAHLSVNPLSRKSFEVR